jgi:predicted small lipoprotein YifL
MRKSRRIHGERQIRSTTREEFRCNFMMLWHSPWQGNLCMVPPAFGDIVVNRKSSPMVSGWAAIVLSVLALTLAGCGRKGGLDAPPGAAGASGQTANAAPAAGGEQDTAANKSSSLFNASTSADSSPTAPKGIKRPFVLDPLLDSH